MRKIIFVAIVGVALLLGGCKRELITTQYTIGCLGYQYGSVRSGPEDWDDLESYFSTTWIITSWSHSRAILFPKMTQAGAYFDEQVGRN